MRLTLDRRFVEQLMDQPESGMGYHRVDIRFTDGRELKNVIVLNSEEADVPDEFITAKIAEIRPHGG
jgi:hypothetical protein